ncbi:DUF6518 family protein [Streptomyces sp. UH6]|uniref:DUF6518 family protein n=1 Tax=Streptomyces sp. UH6 TaxID=2748379 RepID=UPI0015D4F9BB|nr:DUF6518 family protein [Streptomyces sp. UH6]NYV74185.1 hypothetical protein [Streptomyces sp. UH6]
MTVTESSRRAPALAAAPARPWVLCAAAVAVGLAGGAATSFGQSVLTGGWHALVNSAAPWTMVAFLVGLRAAGHWPRAACAGMLSQAGLVAGYYVTSELRGFAAGMSAVVIWTVAGVVAGPVLGAAAALRDDDRRYVRTSAAGVTGSVWIMEGLNFLWLATDAQSNSGPGTTAGWCYLVVGVVLPLVGVRGARDRAHALLALVVGAGAAIGAGWLINAAFLL